MRSGGDPSWRKGEDPTGGDPSWRKGEDPSAQEEILLGGKEKILRKGVSRHH